MKRIEELGISTSPWSIVDFCASHYGVASVSGYRTTETRRIEDARLIAAAPDLYKCLSEAVNENCDACIETDYDKCRGRCFVAKWRAALAKASGEEVAE